MIIHCIAPHRALSHVSLTVYRGLQFLCLSGIWTLTQVFLLMMWWMILSLCSLIDKGSLSSMIYLGKDLTTQPGKPKLLLSYFGQSTGADIDLLSLRFSMSQVASSACTHVPHREARSMASPLLFNIGIHCFSLTKYYGLKTKTAGTSARLIF